MSSGAELTWQATVAANLLEARKKNRRIGSRKSRAGCLTCKTRRVKCDERFPQCDRCTSSGRKCDGYAVAIPKKTGNSLIGGQLSQTLGLRDNERRTFDYFLSWTAPRLAGAMDKFFWCGQVLQLAQAEPVVVHSLLAISTLYEHPQFLSSFHRDPEKASLLFKVNVPPANRGYNVSDLHSGRDILTHGKESHEPLAPKHPPHPSIIRPPPDQHHVSALRHYNRAIQAFKDRMSIGRATPWLALLSCVLFICIELLRDHVFGALNLFSKGLDLLKQVSANPQGIDQQLLETLKRIFGRMGLMVAIYGYPLDVPQEPVELSVAGGFANLDDARTALCALMFDCHSFIRDTGVHKANLGYEEPQDPMSFNASPGRSNPVTESGRAVLPPRLGVPAEAATRLYVGCLPEDNGESARIDSGRDLVFPGSEPSSSRSPTEVTEPCVKTPGTIDTSVSQSPSGASVITTPSSQSSLPSEFLNTKDSTPLRAIAVSTLPSSEQPPSHNSGVWDISERSAWWVPPELMQRRIMLERRLGQWYDAFHSSRATDEEAASNLLMQYHVAFIWQATRLSPYQTAFDDHTSHFQEILRLAEIFIKCKSTERPTFTFDIGVVPQLYFVVTKCRIPSVRRRGLQLMMRAPRKEFSFGSKSCAEIAARLVAVEEEGLGHSSTEVADSVLPQEENRVQSYEIIQDNFAGSYEVRITRYRVDEYGRRERIIMDYSI